jgi:hypothetical protein
MQKHLKNMLSFAATSLVALTSFVNADTDSAQLRNLDNRVTALEQRKGASGMINPPGRPQVRDGADLFVYGDLLFWNAHENGLPVAVVQTGGTATLTDASIETVHGKWNWGFRVGLGYNMPHDGWDINLTWLRFTDHGRKSVSAETGVSVFPTLLPPADPLFVTSFGTNMKSRWGMRIDQLDLDMGRSFFVSKWLTLRPHFGLRTDWLKQSLNATYSNADATASPNSATLQLKDRWYGLGLEGDAPAFGSGIASGFVYDVSETYRVSHPALDMQLGLRWDNMFECDRFHLGLQIAWEHHVYFSQNQFMRFTAVSSQGPVLSNQGDLTFQGWTFEARFDF